MDGRIDVNSNLGRTTFSLALPRHGELAFGQLEPLNALPGFLASGLSFIAMLINAESGPWLDAFLTDRPSPGVVTGRRNPSSAPKVAFLFTGQGAQVPGIGAQHLPEIRDPQEGSAASKQFLGLLDLRSLQGLFGSQALL
jgi:hypothetical protein